METCILGLDPGLRFTGWGAVNATSGKLGYKGHGVIAVPSSLSITRRLNFLFNALCAVISEMQPDEVAIEEIFVNQNGVSTMKLCMARGVVLLAPASVELEVFEYGANCIKKTVTGDGHASKDQVEAMVRCLLPDFLPEDKKLKQDCTDALAIAICHAHHRNMHQILDAKTNQS